MPPGRPPASAQAYFEVLCLCILQAGLNWGSIRKHWARYKEGFLGFDVGRLAQANPEQVMSNPGAIKNRRKVEAIIENAKEFLRIEREFGTFSAYLATLRGLSEHDRLKALAKRFRQVGPETADYYLHAIGDVGS